jgi:hypothetical protein
MSEVKNKLNEIMQLHVQNGEFKSQAARDRRAYYNATQLQNEIENLESQLDAGIINQLQFEAAMQVVSETLDRLIEEDKAKD